MSSWFCARVKLRRKVIVSNPNHTLAWFNFEWVFTYLVAPIASRQRWTSIFADAAGAGRLNLHSNYKYPL
jgi:hypothetical protein